jgi:hypothetical protein
VAVFEAAFAKAADPFDPQGAGAHFAESTIAALRDAYRRWLRHVMLTEPEALALPPADRVTPIASGASSPSCGTPTPSTRLQPLSTSSTLP